MSNVIYLEERIAARKRARHVIGGTAAVLDADRALRVHLMQEAFEEQERAGDGLSFEAARKRVDQWLAQTRS
jgi:hypothetical protein